MYISSKINTALISYLGTPSRLKSNLCSFFKYNLVQKRSFFIQLSSNLIEEKRSFFVFNLVQKRVFSTIKISLLRKVSKKTFPRKLKSKLRIRCKLPRIRKKKNNKKKIAFISRDQTRKDEAIILQRYTELRLQNDIIDFQDSLNSNRIGTSFYKVLRFFNDADIKKKSDEIKLEYNYPAIVKKFKKKLFLSRTSKLLSNKFNIFETKLSDFTVSKAVADRIRKFYNKK